MPIANFSANAPLAGSPQRPGQMETYVAATATGVGVDDRIGVPARAGSPAPRGVSLSGLAAESIWSEMAESLRLRPAGIVTVWATRRGDMSWDPHAIAETNICLYFLNDAAVRAAVEVAYGHPLPFVAIVTAEPMSETEVAEMWQGTAYTPYQTEAIFRQSDQQPVPTILFLHWGQRDESADAPQRLRPLTSAAADVFGQLMFASQVPAASTSSRDFPATPFPDALGMQLQLTEPGNPGNVITQPSGPMAAAETPPSPTGTRPIPWKGMAFAVGLATAIGTYFWQTSRRRS